MNPNNRAPGSKPPPHPEFGDPMRGPDGQRAVPRGAVVRDNVVVQQTMRGGRPFIRMRPIKDG